MKYADADTPAWHATPAAASDGGTRHVAQARYVRLVHGKDVTLVYTVDASNSWRIVISGLPPTAKAAGTP